MFDWCATGLTLATVDVNKGITTLRNSAFLEWPAGLDPFSRPDDCGAWLRLQCEQRAIAMKNVIVLLPRNLVQVRLLKFPVVSDTELDKLVALQMENRSGSGVEQLAWDLLVHPTAEDSDRFVTVLTIPERAMNAMIKATAVAGFSVSAVTCGDLCLSQLREASDDSALAVGSTQFFVLSNRSKLEVQAVRNQQPIASATQSVEQVDSLASASVAKHVISLAQRLNAGLPQAWQVDRISTYHIAGQNSDSLAAELARTGVQVHVLNRDEREPRILATVARLCSSGRLLDPVHPQRERQRQAATRSKIRLAACALGLAVAGGIYVQSVMADSAAATARLQLQRDQLADYAERGKSVLQTTAAIQKWKNETRDCSQELAAVLASVKSPEDIVLTRVQLEHQTDSELPVIRLDGMVRSSEVLKQLHQSLLQTPQVQAIRPQGVEPSPENAVLPIQFRLELVLAEKAVE
ncbi:MAG: hypothetical protein U0996_11270 [Planctomycetaceae bacterium]